MRRSRTSRFFLGLAAVGLVAACSGGGDITDSGESPTSPTDATVPTGDTGGTDSTAAATTTTVAPDTLPDCPTDALESATGTTEITFWHSMSAALGEEVVKLTDAYNSSQSKVKVNLVQGSYEETADNYYLASQGDRPDLVQLPEYQVQAMVDTASTVPVGKCLESSGFDTSTFLPTALAAYETQGVQWSMPFNLSNPVLFYNKKVFAEAGLDPESPPISLEQMREYSEQIVSSGAATYGLALESGFDSGGGWYVEQWFCKAQEFYVDGDNGRTSRATQVLYNNQTGVDLLTFLQGMLADGSAVNVGDNTQTGFDNLLKLADDQQPAAMTIATSASLGQVLTVLGGGQFPQLGPDDVGVGPMPGPDGAPGALIGGASLWPVDTGDDVRTAATWDYITYLVGAEQQSQWAAATGYIPVRTDALEVEPYATTLATDPRFSVAYEQLLASPDTLTSRGPVVGPLREIRTVLATAIAAIFDGADVQTTLDNAADQANGLITDYNARND
ncbi:MAG: ABC transporter substrate-binding protein [Actinomycetota bacterium]|nr:ABC transporter substrate-binding protein [Actinomycetota bacterium]